ncbi:adhesin [Actinoplanes sp. L3-i22]|uniref:adhesin n=1 Tax=Actinoplanes sp. L3-i22 TaxID=2836373 RepID=UPI001C858DD7|nr:adhesin [Actinoplanes sp. L3-i22]
MRTTVGPLPSAVYWRRRAVVLGALLLGLIALFVACSQQDDKPADKKNASSSLPTPAPASGGAKAPSSSASPTDDGLIDSAPPGGQAYPDPVQPQSTDGDSGLLPSANTNTNGTNTNANGQSGTACADTEISVTPVPAAKTVKRGANLAITLTIKNIGSRTCTRDVGADPQELYLEQGAQKYWSSDKCSTAKGSDVQTLKPGEQRNYNITWNGRQSTACSGVEASGPAPAAGQYTLRGRLDTIVSSPVDLTIS